ncbi:MAG: hypothetical protein M3Y22_01000 [Pseudomonadota bacterium]|nr:hypothetical protein [Pseudomonadota bacterium]
MNSPGTRVSAVGIGWYKRADYPRILEVMDDRQVLPETFDKWQRKAENLERDVKAKGMIVIRAHIDPEEFVAWCAARSLNIDAAARMRWGNEAAHRKASGQSRH